MNKKLVSIIVVVVVAIIAVVVAMCTGLFSNSNSPAHKHNYSTTYSYNDNYHWFECECKAKNAEEQHSFTNGKCECGYKQHIHDYKTLKNDTDNHWYECTCGEKNQMQAHAGGTATCTEKAVCSTCGLAYGKTLEHQYTEWNYTIEEHWKECACGDKKQANPHEYKNGICECGFKEPEPEHVCEYDELKYNDFNHWYECECGLKQGTEAHKEGTATCIEKAVCTVCEQEYGQLLSHEYDELKKNDVEHWYECSCGDKSGVEAHKGGTATETQKAKCSVCNTEYGELLQHTHNYNELKHDNTSHWYECSCGDKSGLEAHKGGTATETQKAKCSVCNTEYGELLKHTHNYNVLRYDDINHWNECACGDKSGLEAHKGGTATETQKAKCSVCNTEYGELLKKPTSQGLVYTLIKNNTEYSVIGYNGNSANVYIPSTYNDKPVTKVESGTFFLNKALTSVTISSAITSIDDNAFNSCPSLQEIKVEEGNSVYKDIEGNLYTKDGTMLIRYAMGKTATNFVISNDVVYVGNCAFSTCNTLQSVTISSSIEAIGDYAFSSSSLQSVTFESNSKLTSIGVHAFAYCGLLQNIIIPNSVTSIWEGAFAYCDSLETIEIPNSVIYTGSYILYSCALLKSVTFEQNSQLTSIGSGAFAYCPSLQRVEIPNSVTSILYDAFYQCQSLQEIKVDEENVAYKDIDGNLYSKDGKTLIKYAIGKIETTFEVPSCVTSIGERAFEFCETLQSITFEENSQLTSIGKYAFFWCRLLTDIEILNTVTSIGEGAFNSCHSLEYIYCEAESQPQGWDSNWKNGCSAQVVWGS